MSTPERRRRSLRYVQADAVQADVAVLRPGDPSPYSRQAHAQAPVPAAPAATGDAPVPPADGEFPAPAASQEDVQPLPDAPVPPARGLVATNTGVRLACTMAAMMGLLALFLCWAERESRVIRRFSVQSACLTALHAAVGCAVLLLGGVLGAIPYVGAVVTLLCLLGYIVALMLLLALRVRLMRCAWQGVRFTLHPALERIIARFY